MKLSDFVAAFLASKGIRHAFIISGGASIHLLHSIADQVDIAAICPHHEQAAAMAAGDVLLLENLRLHAGEEKNDPEKLAQREAEYKEKFANPFVAGARGFIDDVINPRETRPRVIQALRMLENKVDTMPRKKHGNIPL